MTLRPSHLELAQRIYSGARTYPDPEEQEEQMRWATEVVLAVADGKPIPREPARVDVADLL